MSDFKYSKNLTYIDEVVDFILRIAPKSGFRG